MMVEPGGCRGGDPTKLKHLAHAPRVARAASTAGYRECANSRSPEKAWDGLALVHAPLKSAFVRLLLGFFINWLLASVQLKH